jgi:choline dehydrogenase-like flavoprotein
MAAARLVERGVRTTLLDAGVAMPKGLVVRAAGNTIFRWVDRASFEKDRHVHQPSEDVEWYSSRSHGGLSNYWTGAVPRFAPEDFEEGKLLDERFEWPISYGDLLPYYEVAESYVIITASSKPFPNVPANLAQFRNDPPADWRTLAERAAAEGHFLGPIPLAKGKPWMAARRATEFNSYFCIIVPLLKEPNFRFVPGAEVTRLEYDPQSQRVSSVEYLDHETRTRKSIPCRSVVVAAGAIDSAAILLRSTSADFPDGLGNSSGVLGRYLHDHPREWWTATPSRRMTALAHPLYVSRGPYDASRPLMATSLTIGLTSPRDRLRTYVRGKAPSFGVQVFGTMIPRPDTRVSLDGEVAGADDRRPLISIRYDQDTIDNVTGARRRLVELFKSGGESVDLPGPFHKLTPGSSVHYGGTVRMHASPQFGVLDRWNRMHDVPNVVVCDSSCFTTGPEKNPALTSMAIAARAADHLADELLGARGASAW